MAVLSRRGAGGVAVAVHTTSMPYESPKSVFLEAGSRTCAAAIEEWFRNYGTAGEKSPGSSAGRRKLSGAGLAGRLVTTPDCSRFPRSGMRTIDELIAHAVEIAGVQPLFGFTSNLSRWKTAFSRVLRRFVRIPNVIAIKIAPFNRYQTIDVVRAVADEGRVREIALYTGNDDSIISDLLTHSAIRCPVWKNLCAYEAGYWDSGRWAPHGRGNTREDTCPHGKRTRLSLRLLSLNAELTDVNAALFDAAILSRVVSLESTRFSDVRDSWKDHTRSIRTRYFLPTDEVMTVYTIPPASVDDEFILAHKDEWMWTSYISCILLMGHEP